jgi:histone H3/H4
MDVTKLTPHGADVKIGAGVGIQPQNVGQTAHKKQRKQNKTMAIPYACIKRLAQNQSSGMRISSDAVFVIEKALEDFSAKLISVSKSYTEHRNRKTITSLDVDVALKNIAEM